MPALAPPQRRCPLRAGGDAAGPVPGFSARVILDMEENFPQKFAFLWSAILKPSPGPASCRTGPGAGKRINLHRDRLA